MPRSDTELDLQLLGQSLRLRRKQMGRTMQSVAVTAGVSVGLISQVERGLAKPSLATLDALAGALGLRAGNLLDDRDVERLRRADIALTPERVLSNPLLGGAFQVVLRQIAPGEAAPDSPACDEAFIFVLSGSVTLQLDGVDTVLQMSESHHFLSRSPYRLWNHTDMPAAVLDVRSQSKGDT